MQRGILAMTIGVVCVLSACKGGSGQGQSGGGNRGNSNRPPTITGAPSPSILPGEVYEFTPNAADPNGDALAFSILRKPAWASFDRATGRLSGTPDAGDVGSYTNISISVSDGRTGEALPSFDIVVIQGGENSATISWIPPTENADGSALTDLAGYRIYYGRTFNSLQQSIVLNKPGLARYVVENLSRGKWHFAMTVVNARGAESDRSPIVSQTVG